MKTYVDNITKQQAVEIMKKAFDLKDFNNREDGKSFYREEGESVSFFLIQGSMTGRQL